MHRSHLKEKKQELHSANKAKDALVNKLKKRYEETKRQTSKVWYLIKKCNRFKLKAEALVPQKVNAELQRDVLRDELNQSHQEVRRH